MGEIIFILIIVWKMIQNLIANATYGENWTGKLYVATDYDGAVFPEWNTTNEATTLSAIENNYVFADVGYFENFVITIGQGDSRVITTDYCGVGEIARKQEKVSWFSVDVQEILEMENLALILGENLSTDDKKIVMKRIQKSLPYCLFKFVTCEKGGKKQAFYFVKSVLSGDITIPFNNLAREDFTWATLAFEVAQSGNFAIDKDYIEVVS